MRLVSNFFRNIYPNCCNQHSVDEKWLGILARPETKRAWSYSSFISFSKASFQSMILFLRVIRCYLLMKSLSSRMWSPEESYEAMGDWSNAGHLSTWPRGTLHRFVVPLLYVRGNAVWSAFVEPRVITVVCHDRCTTTDWIVSDIGLTNFSDLSTWIILPIEQDVVNYGGNLQILICFTFELFYLNNKQAFYVIIEMTYSYRKWTLWFSNEHQS